MIGEELTIFTKDIDLRKIYAKLVPVNFTICERVFDKNISVVSQRIFQVILVLFPKIKTKPRNSHTESEENMQQNLLKAVSVKDFQNCFQIWKHLVCGLPEEKVWRSSLFVIK